MKIKILIFLVCCVSFAANAQGVIHNFAVDTLELCNLKHETECNSINSYQSVDNIRTVSDRKHTRKYRQAQRRRIQDIDDAARWLGLNIYPDNGLTDVGYKSVEGGFLIAGEFQHYTDAIVPYYKARRASVYFVGCDHRMVELQSFSFMPPREYLAEISIDSVSYKFHREPIPNDTVCLPAYSRYGGGMDGFIWAIKDEVESQYEWKYTQTLGVNRQERPQNFPIQELYTVHFTIDSLGHTKHVRKGIMPAEIFPMAVVETVTTGHSNLLSWSPGSVNGEAVPVEVSLTVHCTIDRNPEYDKWPHYTWRELLDKQRQNK